MTQQYGLMLQKRMQHTYTYIEAIVCRREGDKVLGISSRNLTYEEGCPENLRKCYLDGLGMRGFISDFNAPSYIGFQPDYRDVYSIALYEAERMTRTLKRIEAQIHKDESHTATEVFESLARALKLTFVAERTDQPPPYGWNEAE